MIRSHGTKLHMLPGTQVVQCRDFQTKSRLWWTGMCGFVLDPHCAPCVSACAILYLVTGLCRGPLRSVSNVTL